MATLTCISCGGPQMTPTISAENAVKTCDVRNVEPRSACLSNFARIVDGKKGYL
jgi:hypothetical protein